MTDIPMDSAATSAPLTPQERFRRLGDIVVDRETRCVLREGESTRLEPRVFALLIYFMDNPGREISRQELGTRVWNGVHVVDEAIQRAISVLRQALGDTPKQGLHIQTTSGGGYRLVSDVGPVMSQSAALPANWRNLAIAAAAGVLVGVTLMSALGSGDAVAPEAPAPAERASAQPAEAPAAP